MDKKMALTIETPKSVRLNIASKAKARRLFLNISQKELADRSGVSLGSVKRFESTGQISLASLTELALVLGALEGFSSLFPGPDTPASLFEPEPKPRKRSSRKR